jgi:hypothetical protein
MGIVTASFHLLCLNRLGDVEFKMPDDTREFRIYKNPPLDRFRKWSLLQHLSGSPARTFYAFPTFLMHSVCPIHPIFSV